MQRTLCFAVLISLACANRVPVPTAAPTESESGARVQAILPSQTDPAITTPNDAHLVYVPKSAQRNGKLLVFLPGTGGKPGRSTYFMNAAADAGYLGIALDYPTALSAGDACGRNLNCYSGFRHELWDGNDTSPAVTIAATDAIHGRLVALLKYLAQNDAHENWGAFLSNDEPIYRSIVFAGLSQGGGHAAFIASMFEVGGVIMFSSVGDSDHRTPARPATWVSSGHVTPSERYYGFEHDHDMSRNGVDVDWPAIGMQGPRTSVDDSAPPYGGSHMLTTNVPYKDGRHAHGLVVSDTTTPMTSDGPQFAAAWRTMLATLGQ